MMKRTARRITAAFVSNMQRNRGLVFRVLSAALVLLLVRDCMFGVKVIDEMTPDVVSNEPKPDVCADWDTNMDDWWTHHPDWFVSTENDTHYCFSYMQDPEKALFLRQLYNVQYNSDCSNVVTQDMGSCGWGADFLYVNEGLLYAYKSQQPMQIYPYKGRWHYAAKKDASAPVCPRKDMTCYFLNISSCEADPDNVQNIISGENAAVGSEHGRWVYEYATRPQTWLRKKIYDLTSKTELVTPCTVAHVRRSDVVLKGSKRKYHAIQEYVDAAALGGRSSENIFLVTDDQNAIEEALALFPDYNWMYLDRPRYRGAEGGWEQQIPSDDPVFEVVVILSIFKLAEQCETFVYSRSRFASQIGSNMPGALHINLDDGHDVFSDSYALSVNISQAVPEIIANDEESHFSEPMPETNSGDLETNTSEPLSEMITTDNGTEISDSVSEILANEPGSNVSQPIAGMTPN